MTDKNKEALDALKFIEFCNSSGYWKSEGVASHLDTIRQALERPQVDVAGLRQTVADCEDKHGLQKGFYWQAWRHGWNECIDHLNEQGYLSQPEVIEVDLMSICDDVALEICKNNNKDPEDQDEWYADNKYLHSPDGAFKCLVNKYKNKLIRIVDSEGE